MASAIWERLTQYLRLQVAIKAEILDQDSTALEKAFQGLGDRHLLALQVPQNLGGGGLTTAEYYQATVEIAAVSGSLAFLQTQHQSAANRLARFGSPAQQALLPDMAAGKVRIGVGFSHLRRRGKPMLRAEPKGEGYSLTGTIPWVTGYGFFQRAIAGATLPDGAALYGIIPLRTCQGPTGGTISCSDSLPLAAMGVSQTTTVRLENWLMSPADVLVIQSPETIHQGDRQQILHHGFFALGCAQGCLNYLQTREFPELVPLKEHWQNLQRQLFAALGETGSDRYQDKLQLRIAAIQTAQTFAQIALSWTGGSGNLLTSPAQRLYREAMMFSIFGQTQAIREATVKSLLPGKASGYTDTPNYAGVVQW
ncbi:acyl-CoA dehydrogenase family protein [Picosynechococcus sp. NKBG15041c]|uniref:acyl-CoA dehydrogenase family protein n=1 Tax=Picosynechococcus sp. NKBG15041c TaxID=1407650 RepID=UPI000466F263|nr:acyl-CoA dehydrogenase family protein [Picosynechococcus sp. NKBG15041c]